MTSKAAFAPLLGLKAASPWARGKGLTLLYLRHARSPTTTRMMAVHVYNDSPTNAANEHFKRAVSNAGKRAIAPSNLAPRTPRTPKPPTVYDSDQYGVVTLKGNKSRLFRNDGSCLIYAGAIERATPRRGEKTLSAAEPVAVVDGSGVYLGCGFWSQYSMYSVRMVLHAQVDDSNPTPLAYPPFDPVAAIADRVSAAFFVRRSLGLPCPSTNVFRAINGDGDRLSGLCVDIYGTTAVILSSALWVERFRADIQAAVRVALATITNAHPGRVDVIWRMSHDRLKQDGADKLSAADYALIPSLSPETAYSDAVSVTDDVVVSENGVQYVLPAVVLARGQKSGFYADQSDQRRKIHQLVERRCDADVLDLYCYSGGFGINAALAGAASVTSVDSSQPSLAMASVNAAVNGVQDKISFVQDDVPRFLRGAIEEHKQWDVVVLDPPKLAPSAKPAALDRAASAYRKINGLALQVVKPGGILMTCTCSAAMSKDREVFVSNVRRAALHVGREITLLQISGAAADHPIDLSEAGHGGYLTACLFSVR
jgi:23S rRNA G2069 N7-methylase RlmK/C1962 C5-methylase RlmI